MKITVIAKASTSRVAANVCPWVMDVPPETTRK